VPAGQCLGLAQTATGNWKGAADTFASVADLAEQTRDGRAANLWVSAGNAALAGGDAARARTLIDRATGLPTLPDQMRGEAFLDRARADVALAELPQARTDMDQALALVPGDPMAWLLSATLARRAGDNTRARTDIGEATKRAPSEPAILFESGNIYAAAGDVAQARGEWAKTRDLDPDSDVAKSAVAQLAASGGVPPRAVQQGR
jgi:tetratricopeptide (TPR) repeat protein